jgi:hypothetical protein
MGFLGVYTALYDYEPAGEGELTISEGDVLYVLEKSGDDDWWKAKKKASAEDEDEPVGLIPNNYIQEVCSCQVISSYNIGRGLREHSQAWNARTLQGTVMEDLR